MPPKKVEKKEIVAVFNLEDQPTWWELRQYSEEEKQKINDFFTNFSLELQEHIAPNLNETVQHISEKIGVVCHPQFQVVEQEQDKDKQLAKIEEEENTNQQESQQQQQSQQDENADKQQDKVNYLILQNQKYDYVTMKIIIYHFQNCEELNTLKFANNYFSEDVLQILFDYICNPETTKLNKLFFDWNPQNPEINKTFIPRLGNSNIEFLILRSNNINDETIIELCKTIKENPNCQIKHLELYDNKIDIEGLNAIGDLISTYMKIEYLSIAKNNISKFENIKKITQNIGFQILDEEGLEKYQQEEKEKEELLALKAKKKKIDERRLSELNKMLPLKEVTEGSGQFAFVKNPQLKIFNMAMNPIEEEDRNAAEQFIQSLPEDFTLMLLHNNFQQKTKEKLRTKFKKNVML